MTAGRVLIVEDDGHLRRGLALILGAEGYEAVQAADGEQGLQLLREGGWTCVLTDTMMPRMDGLQMLAKFLEGGARLPPVLLVSAAYSLPPEGELRRLGVSEVVPKPFSVERLLAALARATGR